jgi:hypothetical protein
MPVFTRLVLAAGLAAASLASAPAFAQQKVDFIL